MRVVLSEEFLIIIHALANQLINALFLIIETGNLNSAFFTFTFLSRVPTQAVGQLRVGKGYLTQPAVGAVVLGS